MDELSKDGTDKTFTAGGAGLGGAGFLSKSERPYAGSIEGRIEDSARDARDHALKENGTAREARFISEAEGVYDQHGDVGKSGSYRLDWKVER